MGSFPNIKFGAYGDEKVTGSVKMEKLGTLMMLPDGRKFRYARSGGSVLAVGTILREGAMEDLTIDQALVVASSAALGDESISLIMNTTTLVENYLQDGYLYTSLSAGVGSVYKIKSHPAQTAISETIKFTLADNDKVALAIVAASSQCGVKPSEYALCLTNPAGSAFLGVICGIPPVAVTASAYFWCQRSGAAVAMAGDAAMILGEGVSASSADAGSLTITDTAGDEEMDIVGHCMAVGAASTYVLINLELE